MFCKARRSIAGTLAHDLAHSKQIRGLDSLDCRRKLDWLEETHVGHRRVGAGIKPPALQVSYVYLRGKIASVYLLALY